jgi:twinfilin-like protein
MREIHLSKSLAMPVAEDALAALRRVAEDGGLVVLKINPESESVLLDAAEPAASAPRSIADLVTRTSTTDPRFSFFRYTHTHAGAESSPLLFIYTNPSTGGTKAIKNRMLYPLMKRAVVEAAAREGLTVDKRFEVENPAELTEEDVLEELHPKAEVKQTFSRPKRPGR